MVAAAGRTIFPEEWLPDVLRIVEQVRGHRRAQSFFDSGEAEVMLKLTPSSNVIAKGLYSKPGFRLSGDSFSNMLYAIKREKGTTVTIDSTTWIKVLSST